MHTAKLGQGGFGTVRAASSIGTGRQVAVKVIRKSAISNLCNFQEEIRITKSLDFPGIVKLYETFEDRRQVYMVLELCSGGELFDQIVEAGHLTEKQAASITQQISRSLAYMHGQYVCHRDVKPENFIFASKGSITDTPLKLIDFGLSRQFQPGEVRKSAVGTPAYAAPEVICGAHTLACDLWSCGVILYILLCGFPPFSARTDKDIIRSVKRGEYSFAHPAWRRVSESAKNLVRDLMQKDPQRRLAAPQVLENKWISQQAPETSGEALGSHVIENLRNFGLHNSFKRAALTVIAGRCSESQIKRLKEIFLKLDTNKDGTLSPQELKEGMERIEEDLPQTVRAMLVGMDSSGSGTIDYTEFLAAALDLKDYTQEDVCWGAFTAFDQDSSGKISKEELRAVLTHEDVQAVHCQETIDAVLRSVDKDGDGSVDFEEFMDMMRAARTR